jgi:hypothetical protein
MKTTTKFEIEKTFQEVVRLVRLGVGIRKALKDLKINESYFYDRATDQMKAQLRMEKASRAKLGARQGKGMPASELLKRLHDDIVNKNANIELEDEEYESNEIHTWQR